MRNRLYLSELLNFYISDETIPHLYLRYPSIRLFRLLLILRVRLTKNDMCSHEKY